MNIIEFIKNLHINLIYVIVALIGLVGLVGVAIWNRLSAKKDSRIARGLEKIEATEREFSDSCKEFISTFDDALKLLNSQGKSAGTILKVDDTIFAHKAAYDKFRSVVERIRG